MKKEETEVLKLEIMLTGESLENFKKIMKIHRYGKNGNGDKNFVARSLFRQALRDYIAENDAKEN